MSMEYDANLSPANEQKQKVQTEIINEQKKTESNPNVEMKRQSDEHKSISNNSSTNRIQSILNDDKLSDIERWREIVLSILRNTMCYALMPESGKVVVFDSSLPVKHAFRALAEHDIKCAPVFSANDLDPKFIGFMTVTDFADILHFYAQDLNSFNRKVGELERSTVGRWCTFRKQHKQTQISRPFVYAKPDEPMFNAIYRMHQYFIHRMPVRHNHSILCILNHQTILRYVFNKSKVHHSKLSIHVGDLYKDNKEFKTISKTLTHESAVSEAVTLLSTNRRSSAIPICDKGGIVQDAFMRSDIRVLLFVIPVIICIFMFVFFSFLLEIKLMRRWTFQ